MALKSLGVEPYEGKVLEDREVPEPFDGNLTTDPWKVEVPVPTPEEWVRQLAARRQAFFSTAGPKPFLDSGENLPKAEAIGRWLRNGVQGLFTQAEVDVVASALTRDVADPVDPSEGPQERRERDQALALVQAELGARRASLGS